MNSALTSLTSGVHKPRRVGMILEYSYGIRLLCGIESVNDINIQGHFLTCTPRLTGGLVDGYYVVYPMGRAYP